MLKTIHNKDGDSGGHRKHAAAMLIEDMHAVIDWSQWKMPFETAEKLICIKNGGEKADALIHIAVQAQMTTGFILFTWYTCKS